MKILKNDKLLLIGKILSVTILIAWLFYDSLWGLLWMVPVSLFLIRGFKTQNFKQAQYVLEKQFQSGLVFAAGTLKAGYSVENAFKEAEKDLVRLYGEQGVFTRMLHQINQRVKMNEPLELLVWEMGQQSPSENIRNFSEVFFFASKSGGNMADIMGRTANHIRQRFQVQEEIQLVLASKQLELLILYGMPFGILGYLRLGSATFLEPLYHNLPGVLIMSACVILYGFAWWLSKRIIAGCEIDRC